MPSAQHAGRFRDCTQLTKGNFFHIHRTAGKTTKAAIGIEKQLVGTVKFQGFFGLGNDDSHRLHLVGARIDHAQAQFPVRYSRPTTSMSPALGVAYSSTNWSTFIALQGRQQSGIITGEQYVFLLAPVTAANMDTDTNSVNSFNDPVDQVGSEFQFLTRITAGSKGRSHEGAPVAFLRHDHFGQHRFVELDKVAAGIAQVEQFFPQYPDNIIGHLSGTAVGLRVSAPTHMDRVNSRDPAG